MPRRMRDMARRRMRARRRERDMRDRAYNNYRASDYGDYNYDYGYDYRRGDRRRGRDSADRRNYSYDYDYGYDYPTGDYASGRRDRYRRDYGEGDYLEEDELMEWSKELFQELEEKDKSYFSKENIERKAQEMGIKFEEFTFPEFYTTALMTYTDYKKSLGTANMDVYLRLAKDWLEDDDVEVQGGEKLAVYYEEIVCAD